MPLIMTCEKQRNEKVYPSQRLRHSQSCSRCHASATTTSLPPRRTETVIISGASGAPPGRGSAIESVWVVSELTMQGGGTLNTAPRRACASGDSGRAGGGDDGDGGGDTASTTVAVVSVETGGTVISGRDWSASEWVDGLENRQGAARFKLARGPGTRTVDSQWAFFGAPLRVDPAGVGLRERSSRRELILPQVPLRLRNRTGVVTARGRTPIIRW